jgi:hypothetical protein
MLDRDLALLYGVETRVLNQAVQRNIKRFPEDFLFALTREEIRNISQIVISSKIKLISKRVGDERRIQGVKVSRGQGKCWGITKNLRFGKSPINSVWRFIGLRRDFPRWKSMVWFHKWEELLYPSPVILLKGMEERASLSI